MNIAAPKPICFVIMPFGVKKTGLLPAQGLSDINFDALWDRALRPMIEGLGYEPVRADQDVGALIIHEMLERLYFSDLVLAEMTIPNGNVYYEVGIRHACRKTGCVLLAAEGSKQLFDVAQMRTLRYPLDLTEVDAAAAARIQSALASRIEGMQAGASPIYEVLPGYPAAVDPTRASVMQEALHALSKFQQRFSAIRVAPRDQQHAMVTALIADACAAKPISPATAQSLLKLLEHLGLWQQILELLPQFSAEISAQPTVVELSNLAKSKLGDHLSAIAGLEALIKDAGATSEREGLIGGRYKRLFLSSSGLDRARYLNQAILHYERGMMLDLNDYFPSCNLPRLYRERAMAGDADKAKAVAQVVYYACLRAKQQNQSDPWLRPTLLAAAFDAGDAAAAESLYAEILQDDPAAWRLDTMIDDLPLTLQQIPDPAVRAALDAIMKRLKSLIA